MSNLKIYYYDPTQDNQYSGWGESYEVVPHSTLLAPALREADGQNRYEYRFDAEAGRWQETAVVQPVIEEGEEDVPAVEGGGENEPPEENENLDAGGSPENERAESGAPAPEGGPTAQEPTHETQEEVE